MNKLYFITLYEVRTLRNYYQIEILIKILQSLVFTLTSSAFFLYPIIKSCLKADSKRVKISLFIMISLLIFCCKNICLDNILISY